MKKHQEKRSGFTLIELMIVVAVIGILAAISYPSYIDSVRKSRRADAQTALMEAAQRMETFYARDGKYTNATLANNKSPDEYYDIALDPNPGTSTYTIVATPVGDQANDKIQGFRIDQKGKKERTLDGSNWIAGWKEH
jgi:type IV pilus assembly protein PilE